MLSFKRSRFSRTSITFLPIRLKYSTTTTALHKLTPEFYCSPAIKLKLEAQTVAFKNNLPSFPHLFSIYTFGHSELRVMSRLEDRSVFIPLMPWRGCSARGLHRHAQTGFLRNQWRNFRPCDGTEDVFILLLSVSLLKPCTKRSSCIFMKTKTKKSSKEEEKQEKKNTQNKNSLHFSFICLIILL